MEHITKIETEWEKPDIEAELNEKAQPGLLPFDLFAIEHWDNKAPLEESPRQWEKLVREWKEKTLIERAPYNDAAYLDPPSPATEAQRAQIFRPNQTIFERNISIEANIGKPMTWLRTCYDPDLEEIYNELADKASAPRHGINLNGDRELDDKSRYAFEDWRDVYLRVPNILDFGQLSYGPSETSWDGLDLYYCSGLNDKEMMQEVEDLENEEAKPLYRAQLRIQAIVYLLDQEALEKKLVKMLWIDEHGEPVWDNWIDPDRVGLDSFTGLLMDGFMPSEIIGENNYVRGSFIMN
ncbi:hypothetical protein N7481_002682 [Penicillium waksmanii]|uniref:uncharacterized protein n=1 Tax=Penicillium waksmanii TaxID=69791 RepID=UPI002546F25C|nr:uncharacterized protein N7481_002682 [Penicillium waksmanii]KAJ5995705.1 hypothetical protein N7481_002682 [Penicillium waksmanii]